MDAIRTILDLDGMIPIKTILIIHHTDCGMTHQTDEAVRTRCKAKAATPELAAELDDMEFGEITDMDESLRHDVALVKEKVGPYLSPDLQVCGYRYDIKTGKLHAVA
ncbi:hypothetical protein LTR70_010419 [Exophiala xenobiotica]|uniref:Carbonic anhydrase n=1 Tax=Lithohypha guttulata TaxID=1690604 RepID=A0ABR0JU60_9EURO|nr:hypothetical protein LTR24_010391 [Lithohypha guttulata]KAK5309291.1 hypothetical protein LTR70_010419 [Exophiala xenobiotica]